MLMLYIDIQDLLHGKSVVDRFGVCDKDLEYIDEYSSHSKKLRNYSDKIDKIVPKLFGTGQG